MTPISSSSKVSGESGEVPPPSAVRSVRLRGEGDLNPRVLSDNGYLPRKVRDSNPSPCLAGPSPLRALKRDIVILNLLIAERVRKSILGEAKLRNEKLPRIHLNLPSSQPLLRMRFGVKEMPLSDRGTTVTC